MNAPYLYYNVYAHASKTSLHAKKRNSPIDCAETLQFYPDYVDVDGIDDHARKSFHFVFDGFF